MADAKRDENRITAAIADAGSGTVGPWLADNSTSAALVVIYPTETPPTGQTGDAPRDENREAVLIGENEDGSTAPLSCDANGYLWITLT